ncbi:ABC transporter ATP-binding protein [Acidipila sp. EB88]|uniref:ABC transporter ATP-binding protein n=1 Tax=Acidipila sp. EB88 TaxID=2305226 RepID=UPI000F5F0F40|nr:ABC transporter ATP-binding protein [Acidipila sp. EB88]RRA49656.1 ABC transporter ATP-binding protein [Acidipila sp. EB88]
MAALLRFDQITKRYGRQVALDSLTLTVEAGEIFGFVGPNGAGKSTAIRIAMGFLHASAGRGELLGVPFAQARAARAGVGYVPDAPVFFASTPLEAVLFAGRLNSEDAGQTDADLRTRALELLRWLDLPVSFSGWRAAGKADARKLSRGQQQRLAIAQALVSHPRLLVLDEPTSALDPPGVSLVREALVRSRAEGTAVFFSSHQLQEVETLCDRAAFLAAGKLVAMGSMAELLREGDCVSITVRRLQPEDPFVRLHASTLSQAHSIAVSGDLVFVVPVHEQQCFLEQAWLAGAELVEVVRQRRRLQELFEMNRRASESGYVSGAQSDNPTDELRERP